MRKAHPGRGMESLFAATGPLRVRATTISSEDEIEGKVEIAKVSPAHDKIDVAVGRRQLRASHPSLRHGGLCAAVGCLRVCHCLCQSGPSILLGNLRVPFGSMVARASPSAPRRCLPRYGLIGRGGVGHCSTAGKGARRPAPPQRALRQQGSGRGRSVRPPPHSIPVRLRRRRPFSAELGRGFARTTPSGSRA